MPIISKKLIIIGVILFLIAGYGLLNFTRDSKVRSVTTIGIGKQLVDADKAVVTFSVTVTNNSRTEIITEGENTTSDILKKISPYNPTQITKSASQLVPIATQGDEYRYSTAVRVTVEGKDNIQSILKTLKDEQVVIVQIRYLSANNVDASEAIRKMAVEEARLRAEQIAQASKARLGKVLVVSEQGSNDLTGTQVTNSASADEASFSQIEIQSALSVTFELK